MTSFAQPQGGGARGVAFLGGITTTIANGSQTEKDCPSLFRYNCESQPERDVHTHGKPQLAALCIPRGTAAPCAGRGPAAAPTRTHSTRASGRTGNELLPAAGRAH